MSYTIRSDEHHVEVTLSGRLDYDTIVAMLEELDELATATLPAPLTVLIDETEAGPGLLNPLDIGNWINRWQSATALRAGRIAVVAPTFVMFGLNRMAHGLAGSDAADHLAVFKERDAAMEWLREAG